MLEQLRGGNSLRMMSLAGGGVVGRRSRNSSEMASSGLVKKLVLGIGRLRSKGGPEGYHLCTKVFKEFIL